MKKNNKFYLIIFLILFTSLTSVKSLEFPETSSRMTGISPEYETNYANKICDGDDTIIKAGCSVIAGQAVRTIPAMAFGASFDKMSECAKRGEEIRNGAQTVNLDDTCSVIAMMNPSVDKSKLVFEKKYDGHSLVSITNYLNDLNKDIAENSFDNTYFVYKSVENIPVAKNAFAQTPSTDRMSGLGEFWRDTTFNTWVTFRNVAYGLIGLLSIILGITLMSSNSFLDNNAKWRLSLEQAIPRVVIAVILIQFSYTLGEALLYIQHESRFEPIVSYLFAGLEGTIAGSIIIAAIGLIFVVASSFTGNPIGIGVLIVLIVLGLWAFYRLIILWWFQFTNLLAICIFTIASPVIIAVSLLPGEAGALANRRYFSTIISLVSRSFLLQAIAVGPWIFLALLNNWIFSNPANFLMALFGSVIIALLTPLIVTIIIYQYADNTAGWSNSFAKNITGADPIGAQSSK
jgi:hypothetical protein